MKKVKAIKSIGNYITMGHIYDCVNVVSFTGFSESRDLYKIIADNGEEPWIDTRHFTDVDEPVIEVGSRWTSDSGLVYEVTAVGYCDVLLKLGEDEYQYSKDDLLRSMSLQPKTVKMYFYKFGNEYIAYDREQNVFGANGPAFTREIELP